MKVDNPETDRTEMPEECDRCGQVVDSIRFVEFAPDPRVDWLCKYCQHIFSSVEDDAIVKSIAGMFHELEKSLKGVSGDN